MKDCLMTVNSTTRPPTRGENLSEPNHCGYDPTGMAGIAAQQALKAASRSPWLPTARRSEL
ncbi:hypothetical protein RB213_008310 [Colletotrichum asianum]